MSAWTVDLQVLSEMAWLSHGLIVMSKLGVGIWVSYFDTQKSVVKLCDYLHMGYVKKCIEYIKQHSKTQYGYVKKAIALPRWVSK